MSAEFGGIWNYMNLALKQCGESEKAKFRMAEFYDKLYQRMKEKHKLHKLKLSSAVASSDSHNDDGPHSKVKQYASLLRQCVMFYGEALKCGHKYTYQCMPRMLTLYLETTEQTVEEDVERWKKEEKDRKEGKDKDDGKGRKGKDGTSTSGKGADGSASKRTTRTSTAASSSTSAAAAPPMSSSPGDLKDNNHSKMLELVTAIAPYKWSVTITHRRTHIFIQPHPALRH